MVVKHGQWQCKWNHPLKWWWQKTLREIYSWIKNQMAGESEVMMNYTSSDRNIWWRDCKRSTSGKTRWKKKSRKAKIKVARLYSEGSEIDGCQGMEGASRRHICMGYHPDRGTGPTTRAIYQWRKGLLSCNPHNEIVKPTRKTFPKTLMMAHVAA